MGGHRWISGAVVALSCALAALPASAAGLTPITQKAAFVKLVTGRMLQRFGIGLAVGPGGTITGSAFGTAVTGSWVWRDGFFCRDLAYGSTKIAMNCQRVESDGKTVRFTADRGKGESADLRLR